LVVVEEGSLRLAAVQHVLDLGRVVAVEIRPAYHPEGAYHLEEGNLHLVVVPYLVHHEESLQIHHLEEAYRLAEAYRPEGAYRLEE